MLMRDLVVDDNEALLPPPILLSQLSVGLSPLPDLGLPPPGPDCFIDRPIPLPLWSESAALPPIPPDMPMLIDIERPAV